MNKACECGYYPTIIIPGIGQSKVELIDDEDKKIKLAWPLELDNETLLKGILPSALKMMALRGDRGFTDTLYRELRKAFFPLAATAEGSPKARLRVVSYPRSLAGCTDDERRFIYRMVPMEQLAETIGESHMYFFAYHSFGQPYETARDLHLFIQSVKEETGHDKVNLVPVSLGGSISIAYFDAYGDREDVYRVMNFVPAINGTSVIADVLEDEINLDNPRELLEFILDRKTAEKIASFMKLLPKGMDRKITETALSALRDTVFVNSPAMWAVVPRERYEALRGKHLCDGRHEVLRAKADRFHRAHKDYEELLTLQTKRGVEFFTVCGYGKKLVPFVKSAALNSDSVIDLSSASLGAHAAPVGETLPDGYVPAKDRCFKDGHDHISPDRVVDAGAGLFPDTTWYFSDLIHDDIAYHDVALLLCREILTNRDFTDVYSNPAFPQFNGSRNIKEIKYKLLPRAKELLGEKLHDHVRDELGKAVAECEELLSNTIIIDNSLTQKATQRLSAAVLAADPALTK